MGKGDGRSTFREFDGFCEDFHYGNVRVGTHRAAISSLLRRLGDENKNWRVLETWSNWCYDRQTQRAAQRWTVLISRGRILLSLCSENYFIELIKLGGSIKKNFYSFSTLRLILFLNNFICDLWQMNLIEKIIWNTINECTFVANIWSILQQRRTFS